MEKANGYVEVPGSCFGINVSPDVLIRIAVLKTGYYPTVYNRVEFKKVVKKVFKTEIKPTDVFKICDCLFYQRICMEIVFLKFSNDMACNVCPFRYGFLDEVSSRRYFHLSDFHRVAGKFQMVGFPPPKKKKSEENAEGDEIAPLTA